MKIMTIKGTFVATTVISMHFNAETMLILNFNYQMNVNDYQMNVIHVWFSAMAVSIATNIAMIEDVV